MIKSIYKICFLFGLLPVLAGCGWNPFSFLSDTPEEEPADLVDFDAEVQMRRLWSASIGSGQGKKYNRLHPVLDGERIYVAANNGIVTALDRASGDRLWRVKIDDEITGGVGIGGGMVLIGTQNSDVIAMDMEDGRILWQSQVSSEVLGSPATNGSIVVVQTHDGKLAGLNAGSGEQVWIYENTVPALSLRGTSSPLILNNFVVAAFANGAIVSLALDNGTLRWEERVAIPTGTSEIDRMVDIDGDLVVNDAGLLLVPSYQGYLAAIDVVTGQTRWRVQESSPFGASSGFGNVYISDSRGHIKAYRVGQDNTVWTNDQLDLRNVTGPVSFNNYVAVGDFEGYVHLLSQVDGRLVGRTRVDRGGIRSHMLTRGNTLYVYGNGGTLAAYSVQ